MKVLFLSAWCPLPADNGSKLRVSALIRELARYHSVDLVTFAPENPGEQALSQLHTLCNDVILLNESPFTVRRAVSYSERLAVQPHSVLATYSDRMAEAVRGMHARYDAVIASTIHMAPYALLVDAPRILEEIELTVLRDQFRQQTRPDSRLRYFLTWWKTRQYIAWLLRRFAGASVVSEAEQALVRPLAPATVEIAVVPNGVDLELCDTTFGQPQVDSLVYPGALSYNANLDAVSYFLGSILPHVQRERPGTRLRVTGKITHEQRAALPPTKGVEFTGFVDDVRPVVAQAWAEVVPLRIGGGTRLKVLEAMALGTPIVSTPKGVEGLAIQAGTHALVADDPRSFAEATVGLLAQADLRARLVRAGRDLVRNQYGWNAIGARLESLIQSTATF